MTTADEIMELYARRGAQAYFGEGVSMSEHGLQAAHFAQQAGAPDALVVAALLHDIGHLTESVPDDIADWTKDAGHERSGSRWLARHFGAGDLRAGTAPCAGQTLLVRHGPWVP